MCFLVSIITMIVGEQDNKGKNPFDCFTLNGEKFLSISNVLNQVIQQSHMYMMILKKYRRLN